MLKKDNVVNLFPKLIKSKFNSKEI